MRNIHLISLCPRVKLKSETVYMKILVTNDDGIFSSGIQALAVELSKIAEVVVVAPDREKSAVGTAVTLHQPLRVQKTKPIHPGVETYSVEGTPADSVILASGKLVKGKIDLVVSGINQGLNLGEDVLISGTVGGALIGYLRGFHAFAVSAEGLNNPYLGGTAKLVALLAKRVVLADLPTNIFLNINAPELPLSEVKEVNVTRLSTRSHVNTVEEGHDGKRNYYWLVRKRIVSSQAPKNTDIWSLEQDNISITPLHIFWNPRVPSYKMKGIFHDLLQEAKESK